MRPHCVFGPLQSCRAMKLPAEPVEHRGLLAALIAHERFRVDYAGTGVLVEENGTARTG